MDTHYTLLKTLSEEPRLSQRTLADRLGLSLGKVNFCLSEVAKKGWIMYGVSRTREARPPTSIC